MPLPGFTNYEELCHCHERLNSGPLAVVENHEADPTRMTNNPKLCQAVSSRDSYIGLLTSLGARQIGGMVGDPTSALAFVQHSRAAIASGSAQPSVENPLPESLEPNSTTTGQGALVSFVVALSPGTLGRNRGRNLSVNHRSLPLVLRDLLVRQGIGKGEWIGGPGGGKGYNVIPRPEDITTLQLPQMPHLLRQQGAEELGEVATSLVNDQQSSRKLINVPPVNVPYGESSLSKVSLQDLPEVLNLQQNIPNLVAGLGARVSTYDATFWVQLILFLVAVATLLEGVGNLIMGRIIKGKGETKAPSANQFLLLLFTVPVALAISSGNTASAQVTVTYLDNIDKTQKAPETLTLQRLATEVSNRTSLTLNPSVNFTVGGFGGDSKSTSIDVPWLFIDGSRGLPTTQEGQMTPQMHHWLVSGGFLVIENAQSIETLNRFVRPLKMTSIASNKSSGPTGSDDANRSVSSGNEASQKDLAFGPIAPDHELMRSFYLLSTLPGCSEASKQWRVLHYDDRLMILAIPFSLIDLLADSSTKVRRAENTNEGSCYNAAMQEQLIRTFVNILMVVQATDYKMDQIHLPEILKRLR